MKKILKMCFGLMSLLFYVSLQSCGGGSSGVQPISDSAALKEILYPTVLKNESNETRTVEVKLTAAKTSIDYGTGTKTEVWAYNNVIPGPTIEARVGDKVIVHLTNNLDEATTIHFHGVEVPANMDGSNISQIPIQPGESFTYSFTVNRAATYWYHPHVRSNVQVEKGLYGAFIVRDPIEDKEFKLPVKEHLIVFDDVLLDSSNQIAPEWSDIPSEHAIESLNGREGDVLLVNGMINPKIRIKRGVPNRFRVINASNSKFMRISVKNHELWQIGGDAGLISTSIRKSEIDRIYNPSFRELNQPEYYSNPDKDLGIFLTPGERAEFIFTPNSEMKEITFDWHDIHRGRHVVVPLKSAQGAVIKPKHGPPPTDPNQPPPDPNQPPPDPGPFEPAAFGIVHDNFDGIAAPVTIATFELYGKNNTSFYQPPNMLRTTYPLDQALAIGSTLNIVYGHSQPDIGGHVKFFIKASMNQNPAFDPTLPVSLSNKKLLLENPIPFSQVTPNLADIVRVNSTKIIEIVNTTGGDHNFHLHGFMFQLVDTRLEYDRTPEKNITIPAPFTEYKDTIIIPKSPGMTGLSRSITRLIVSFDDFNREGQIEAKGKTPTATTSGGWVMHCHFLEHSAKGMMSYVQIVP